MGRRSINTTKSGKYMNPTDQASKFKIFQIKLLTNYKVLYLLLINHTS